MLFKDVIGQNEIKQKLKQTVKENRISHAQLFYGKEGTGSLALALAYAQYLNCKNRTDEDACGECPSCNKYKKLIHPDLHFVFPVVKTDSVKKPTSDDFIVQWRELLNENPYFTLTDWYKHIKVENKQGSIFEAESDNIIKKLSLKSFEADFKTMVIWKPEKMNQYSANKLLKLIEEPPPRTILLLVATQLENILPTILSRTFQVNVPGIKNEDMLQALKKRSSLTEAEILSIVKISDGSFSEALNNLEKNQENQFNFENFQELMRFAFSLNKAKASNKDKFASEETLEWVEKIAMLGRERQKSFLINALRMIRENFVFSLNQPEMQFLSDNEHEWSVKFSPYINDKNIHDVSNEINLAHYHIERNANSKIVFFDLALKLSRLIKK